MMNKNFIFLSLTFLIFSSCNGKNKSTIEEYYHSELPDMAIVNYGKADSIRVISKIIGNDGTELIGSTTITTYKYNPEDDILLREVTYQNDSILDATNYLSKDGIHITAIESYRKEEGKTYSIAVPSETKNKWMWIKTYEDLEIGNDTIYVKFEKDCIDKLHKMHFGYIMNETICLDDKGNKTEWNVYSDRGDTFWEITYDKNGTRSNDKLTYKNKGEKNKIKRNKYKGETDSKGNWIVLNAYNSEGGYMSVATREIFYK